MKVKERMTSNKYVDDIHQFISMCKLSTKSRLVLTIS